jgi:hypothetical protein
MEGSYNEVPVEGGDHSKYLGSTAANAATRDRNIKKDLHGE